MARGAAVDTSIDTGITVPSLRVSNRSMATWMIAEGNLALRGRHPIATCCRVMDFVIPVQLLILVEYESWHLLLLLGG